jgi:hypothetical protein
MTTLGVAFPAPNPGVPAEGSSSTKSCGFEPLFRAESAANGET